ncbi:MAG: hypothetical protein QG623_34 [Patescibacteria group bacterium]|nr:hypothetical protein [Patescibacteria group bacterium]
MGEQTKMTIQGALAGLGADLDLDQVAAKKRLERSFEGLEEVVPDDPSQLSVLGGTIAEFGKDACAILDEEGLHPDSGIIRW